ncbi:MAG: single-stranded DNA-binding protein [Elusimicrobiales bacterium]|nr:single-stranded DNA-binding protein [Elusimicrobiales bacterium]
MDIKIPELNSVLVAGRLTRDPEQRFTQKGQGVTSFDLAVNRRYKDAVSGEWKDNTVFVPVSVWGPMADRCKDKLRRGSPVLVEGNLVSSEYADKSGQKRKILRINARRVQFLFFGDGSDAGDSVSQGLQEPAPQVEEFKDDSGGLDEVPF